MSSDPAQGAQNWDTSFTPPDPEPWDALNTAPAPDPAGEQNPWGTRLSPRPSPTMTPRGLPGGRTPRLRMRLSTRRPRSAARACASVSRPRRAAASTGSGPPTRLLGPPLRWPDAGSPCRITSPARSTAA